MASKAAFQRLRKEFKRLQQEPVAHLEAVPLETNILEWHYVISGPPDSPYYGGIYHGKLVFPNQYPYKPPSILMLTPNGRFKTNTRLCLSMSDFHPESWNPLWSVSSILSGLLSFMLESTPTFGSVECSEEVRRGCAAKSLQFNLTDKQFNQLFPHYKMKYLEQIKSNSNGGSNGSNGGGKEGGGPATAAAIGGATGSGSNGTEEGDGNEEGRATDAAKVPVDGDVVNDVGGVAGVGGVVAAVAVGGVGRSDDLFDKLVMAIILVTIAFAITFVYT